MTKRRLSLSYTLGVTLIWVAGVEVAHAAEKKVAICHRPPGNPASAQTISVGESATAAHLKHGDQLGACSAGCQENTSLCDDGNACTSDTCLSNGLCAHAAVSCDDGNTCTTDLCEASTGCLYLPANGTSCDDGNACTGGDTCTTASCQGSALPGCCTSDTDCDDGNACTTDTCADNACQNQPLDCSVADKCSAGFCDPGTGTCGTTPVNCGDSNVCTDDFCDSVTGCFSQPTTNPPEPVEVSCTDGADNDCDGAADSQDPDCEATIEPASGGRENVFTIIDPQGRMANATLITFFEIGQGPEQGIPVHDPLFSADGRTATGTIPGALGVIPYFVTVHEGAASTPPLLRALRFVVTF